VTLSAALWALLAVALAEAFATHLRDGVDVSLMNVAILVILLAGEQAQAERNRRLLSSARSEPPALFKASRTGRICFGPPSTSDNSP
jgi:hypothetical protein